MFGNSTPKKLKKMRVPPRDAGKRFVTLDHQDAVRFMRRAMKLVRLTPGTVNVSVTDRRDEACIAIQAEDRPMWIGLVNSNSGRRRSQMYAGVTHPAGPMLTLTKASGTLRHDTRFDFEFRITEFTQELKKDSKRFEGYVDWLKAKECPPDRGDWLIAEAKRRGLMSSRNDGRVEKARKGVKGSDLYTLYAAFSLGLSRGRVISCNPMTDYLEQTYGFWELLYELR